jgi:hypothetical protein
MQTWQEQAEQILAQEAIRSALLHQAIRDAENESVIQVIRKGQGWYE